MGLQRASNADSFGSVKELIAAIEAYLEQHNREPKRFTWTKDAKTILRKIQHCNEALGTTH